MYGYVDRESGRFVPFGLDNFSEIAQAVYSVLNEY
jgi:hypothetical protein